MAPALSSLALSALVLGSASYQAQATEASDAIVFLGCSGDNALRDNGVWQGLYESYAGGVYAADGIDIWALTNSPTTDESLRKDVLDCLSPLYTKLKANDAWKCMVDDCTPETFIAGINISVQDGYESCTQAAKITDALKDAPVISMYLSIPPSVFGEWAVCAAGAWGADRIHVAAEKPFGTSLENAIDLHTQIADAISEENIHLVDHWLSFFMNRHLGDFRSIVEPMLGITFNSTYFERVVVTEFEVRGLEGRGGFFDGIGQVRDMVQSHLLQVMGLALMDPADTSTTQKLGIFNKTDVTECSFGQYDGFLMEPGLSYHETFADSTYCDVEVKVNTPAWSGVDVGIVTGKDMGLLQYTIEFFQRGGPGVLTIENGKEETGTAGVKVANWPLKQSSDFQAPVGGFDNTQTITQTPAVDKDGNGYILNYTNADMYFPAAYAVMISQLLTHQYDRSFATWAECQRDWEIITAAGSDMCMDPKPENVPIYNPPTDCGNTPPDVCWEKTTVKDEYDVTFACTAAHDKVYQNVSLYQAKCHPTW